MLHILFVILKIIGTILAAIAGILLLALICALFVPVRYRIIADGKLGAEEPVHVEIKVTWLLRIINAVFSYSKAARFRVRVFCFSLLDTSEKKDGRKKRKKKRNRKETDASEKETLEIKETISEKAEKKDNTFKNMEYQEDSDREDIPPAKEKAETEAAPEQEEWEEYTAKKRGMKKIFETIHAFFKKLLEAVENIEYTIQQICDKIKHIMENIRYYTNIMKGEAFRGVWRNAKKQLFWIFRRVKPDKCRIGLAAGTGDPSSTGQIMAVYGMLYPFIGNHVFIEADFENKRMEGDLYIKGKITAIIFLIAAVKLLIDKNVWKLFKLLKKEDA